MKQTVLAFLAALVFMSPVAAWTYTPGPDVAFYFGGDSSGVMELYTGPCPYIRPDYKAAHYFHNGMTMADGKAEPFCWVRPTDGIVDILVPNGTSSPDVYRVDQRKLKRGPAPLPPAANETGV